MRTRPRACCGRLWLLLALTSCALPQPGVPPATYVLEATLPEPVVPAAGAPALEVDAIQAWPQAEGAAMSYLREAGKLERYAESRWLDAPARLLDPLLRRALEGSGGFGAVVPEPSVVRTSLRLSAELETLQQELLTTPSRIRVALRVTLVDLRDRRVLGSRRFEVVQPAPSDDAYGGVQAADHAVSQLLAEVAAYCARLAAER